MPCQSLHQSFLWQLDDMSLRIAQARLENMCQEIDSSSSSSTLDSVPGLDNSSSMTSLFISPLSPISPIWSDSESTASNDTTDSTTECDRWYAQLLNVITAVMTITPDQPCTTLSDHVHAFTACSIVCSSVSRLSLFTSYRHRLVSAFSGLSSLMIT